MATEQTTVKPDEAEVARATAATSSRVTDERTGKTYELEITDGTIKAPDLRQIKVSEDDFGLMSYDPAFLNTASCRSAITWIDGDKGELWHRGIPIEQLCEHSTYLEVAYLLIFGKLPTQGRAGRLGATTSPPHVRPREHQEVRRGLSLRRPPDGHAARLGRRAFDLLSGREAHRRPRRALHGDDPDDRQDADAGGLRLPPQPRAALRLSGQRPRLPRQLPLDDVQDDRARVRARPATRACAGCPLDPARRPRAELLHERRPGRRLVAGGSLFGGRGRAWRRSTGRSTAARTRPSCGCSTGSDRWTTSPTSSRA